MNAERALSAEATVALASVVYGELSNDSGKNLPRPRRLMAIFLFFGALSLVSGFGEGPARLAVAVGGVTTLASLLLGQTGRNIVGLLTRGAGLFGGQVSPGVQPVSSAYFVPPPDPRAGRQAPAVPTPSRGANA